MAETIYTQLNAQGVAIRNVVITKAMINTGKWGDPKTWVLGPKPIMDPLLDPTGKIIAPENTVVS